MIVVFSDHQEAVKKSEQELESQLEKLQHERTQTEARLRELEQRVFSYMEREKKIMQENQHQVDKAAELNGTLRRQLDEKCREVSDLNAKFSKEVGLICKFLSNKVQYTDTLVLSLCPLGKFSCFLSSADFFQNQLFRKILSGI